MQKQRLKTILQHIAVVLCKIRLERTTNFCKVTPFWKLPKMATKHSICRTLALGQKLKMEENILKPFLQHISVVLWRKWLKKKQLILKKWDHFENCEKLPPNEGRNLHFKSIIKNANKKDMLKTFLQHIAVVLCRNKQLEKTANIRKIPPFRKLPEMATK